jgi:hypothetical protein
MNTRVRWTADLDEQLRGLRASGLTWDNVALAMAMGRNTVLERGRRIGARRVAQPVAKVEEEPRDRPARPPGHPASWGLINAGTVLDGVPYPFPVFL